MDIKERSKQYAQGKALEAITAAIEKAYQDGFNDGLNHLALEEQEAAKTGVEYVDLGLPSGTLWSSKNKFTDKEWNFFTYSEALELNIPNLQQYQELLEKCYSYYENGYFVFTGVNGNSIKIACLPIKGLGSMQLSEGYRFWVKNDLQPQKDNSVYLKKDLSCKIHSSKLFVGLKLPVMLVK